ncbi:hypothetical protein C4D60_Mb00t12560 [Musa balbisiana]|uniref:Uncharacterized protein n=1 Tax=Musa balbisiana TaxID=52838 RepID=A0A4S8I2T3_MUSBA|nr:hypothetical protein C4D60_Mb00t12560 [Musa balbisiana]
MARFKRERLTWIPRHPEDEEGRSKRRNASGSQPFELLLNPWAGKRQPGELKHLSSQRKRKQKRFP